MRREVEEVGVGGEVREFFEWAFVWGDVDPHGGGLGACEPDGCTVVVEVRATALFEGLGGGVEEAHACEVVNGAQKLFFGFFCVCRKFWQFDFDVFYYPKVV